MNGTLYTKLFWKDAGERAAWTFAQVVVSIVGLFVPAVSLSSTSDLQAGVLFTLTTLPWVLLAGLGGAAFSVLKSMVAAKKAGTDTASFVVDTRELKG